jgi:hypothetical protein
VAQAQTLGLGLASDPGIVHSPVVDLGTLLPAWSALPFAGILLSIALCPLLVPLTAPLLSPPVRLPRDGVALQAPAVRPVQGQPGSHHAC